MQENAEHWDRFIAFLKEANLNTYANENAQKSPPLRVGWEHYHYESEKYPEFAYDDEYYGRAPFIGEEIVTEHGRPMWGMNYYGRTIGVLRADGVYHFLRKALAETSNHLAGVSARGPAFFRDGDWVYRFCCEGNLKLFNGVEEIELGFHPCEDNLVYRAHVHGGLI